MGKILPCPFCGGTYEDANLCLPSDNTDDLFPDFSVAVVCDRCGAVGPCAETRKEAIEAWNNRVEVCIEKETILVSKQRWDMVMQSQGYVETSPGIYEKPEKPEKEN